MTLSNISRQTISGPSQNWGKPLAEVGKAIVHGMDSLYGGMHQERAKQNLEHALYTTAAHHEAVTQQAQQAHTLSEDSAANEHTRRKELLRGIHQGAEPGSDIRLKHGDFEVNYTRKNKTAKAVGQTTPTHTGPAFVGMPGYRISAPKPAGPKEFVLRAQHPETKQIVRRDSLTPQQQAQADAARAQKGKPRPKQTLAKKPTTKKATPKKYI